MKRNHEVVYNGKTFKRVQVLTALREIGNGREFFMVPEKAPEEFFFNEKHLAKGPIFGGRWPFNTRSSLLLVFMEGLKTIIWWKTE